MEHANLRSTLVGGFKGVDVHRQPHRGTAFLLSSHRDAGVQSHPVDPASHIAVALHLRHALPEIYQCLLIEVCHLVPVFGKHIAHGVDRVLVFSCQFLKFIFPYIHRNTVLSEYLLLIRRSGAIHYAWGAWFFFFSLFSYMSNFQRDRVSSRLLLNVSVVISPNRHNHRLGL